MILRVEINPIWNPTSIEKSRNNMPKSEVILNIGVKKYEQVNERKRKRKEECKEKRKTK